MMNLKIPALRFLIALSAANICLIVSGCGTASPGNGGGSPGNPVPANASGKVHAGTQPVSGSIIQLYAVGNTGSKSAATPLISTKVQTASDGTFDLTNLWTCTDTATYGSDPLLYVVASGGNPGFSTSTSNGALTMMAALGRCSTVTPSKFIYINEVTTVASAYALSPFTSDATHVGTSAGNGTALANAFGSVASLVDSTTGVSPGAKVATTAAVPVNEINTLANALATCVTSSGGASCAPLFAAATPGGGAAPTETLGAILQIARAPLANVAAIFGLNKSSAPFQPSLTAMPTDWSIAIKYTGGGLAAPSGLAVDASGNAWVANSGGNSITEISSDGQFSTGANGYSAGSSILGPQAVAVDKTGNVWLADTLLSSVVKVAVTSGAIQSSVSYTSGISGPTSLAIDSQNHVWVANFGDGSVTELDSSGAPMGSSPLKASGALQRPIAIAIGKNGSVWVADNASSVVAEFDASQALLSGGGFTDDALFAPQALAIDSQGRAWVAGGGSNSASLLQTDGTAAPASPFSGGALSQPTSVAIDGAGVVWLTNGASNGSVTQIQSATATPSAAIGSLSVPAAVAVDASGNLWVASAGDDSVSKFIGIASPVVTPLAAAIRP